MKITKEELRQIINEELENVLAEQSPVEPVTVVKDTVLRAGPGLFNKKLSVVEKGTTVQELSQKGSWVEVKIENMKGWLTKNVLSNAPVSAQKKKRGLAGLRGSKPLNYVEKPVDVTASKG